MSVKQWSNAAINKLVADVGRVVLGTDSADDGELRKAGEREIADKLGVSRQYVFKAQKQSYFSPNCADRIEMIYGVPRETLVKESLRRFIVGNDPTDLI